MWKACFPVFVSSAMARSMPFISSDTLDWTPLADDVSISRRATSGWTYQGCYQDSVGKRTLAYPSNRDYSIQTVETCTTWCTANKYSYCGLEYSTECYGDYNLSEDLRGSESDCSMPCAGNSSQICGNGNRLSVYTTGVADAGPSTNPGPDGWKLLACYTDAGDSRTLSTPQGVSAGPSGMTVAQCTAACKSGGYRFAGLEYGDECYCDNVILEPGVFASTGCNMACAGNSSEFCGGSNRLTIYESSDPPPPENTGSPASWAALGCFTDNAGARTLGTQREVPGGYTNMTVEGCLSVCTNQGYSYSGLEYAQECFCGNTILNEGTCAPDQKSCYMPCRGNTAETCGGSNRLNVYYSGSEAPVSSCGSRPTSTASTSSSTSVAVSSGSSPSTTPLSSTTPVSSTSSTSSATPSSSTTSILAVSSPSTSEGTSSITSASSSPTSSSIASTSSSSSTSASTSTSSGTTSSTTAPSISITTSSSSSTTSTLSCPTSTSTVCPSFWSSIIADLAPLMRDSEGECTDLARAAIRYAFHDAATFSTKLPFYAPAAGGADGSLLLSANEINRADNNGLHDYHATLTQKFATYRSVGHCVGGADLIQVAGSLAVLACPGGRVGRVMVGRTDTTTEAPNGLLPEAFGPLSSHDTIFQLFQDKGFSARDLAALLGAHSTSKANFQTANGMPAGAPQDDTPGLWDVKYYNQTYFPVDGMARFDSDIHLANESTTVGKQFKTFVGNQATWGASFSSAWQAMSILGIPRASRAGFADCTNVVVAAFPA